MKELLQRWSRLEPNRCRHYRGDDSLELFYGGSWNRPFSLKHLIARNDMALIQAAVQEAIAARSWRWAGGSGFSGVDHSVDIYGTRPKLPWLANGRSEESFAAALLEAYLQALQADV